MFKMKKELIKRGKLWRSEIFILLDDDKWYLTNISDTSSPLKYTVEKLLKNTDRVAIYVDNGEVLYKRVEGNLFKVNYRVVGAFKTYKYSNWLTKKLNTDDRIIFDRKYGKSSRRRCGF